LPDEHPAPTWGREHVSPLVVLTAGLLVTLGEALHVPADVVMLLDAPLK
jgi:hypothetical protein